MVLKLDNQRRHNNNETGYRNNMQHNEDVALQYNPNNRINSGEQINISNYDNNHSRNNGNVMHIIQRIIL